MCVIYCEDKHLYLKVVSRFHKSKNRFSESSQALNTPKKKRFFDVQNHIGKSPFSSNKWATLPPDSDQFEGRALLS